MEDTQRNPNKVQQHSEFGTTPNTDLLVVGKNYVKNNEFDKAVKILLEIYTNGRKTTELCRLIGFCYQMLERFELAKQFYAETIQMHQLELEIEKSRKAILGNQEQVN